MGNKVKRNGKPANMIACNMPGCRTIGGWRSMWRVVVRPGFKFMGQTLYRSRVPYVKAENRDLAI
jgi:hypothetical protein